MSIRRTTAQEIMEPRILRARALQKEYEFTEADAIREAGVGADAARREELARRPCWNIYKTTKEEKWKSR